MPSRALVTRAFLLIGGVFLYACGDAKREANAGPLMTALAQLRPQDRPFVALLSLPVAYRPCFDVQDENDLIPKSRCEGRVRAASDEVLQLAARASVAVREQATTDALHAAALVELLWPDSRGKALDRAISLLSSASKTGAVSASVFIDLSAAYLARSEVRQDPQDLLLAAENATLALRRDSANAAASFDLALALSRLELHSGATQEWRRFTRRRAPSELLQESVRRLIADSAIVSGLPHLMITEGPPGRLRGYAAAEPYELRMAAWDSVLPAWGEAEAAEDSRRASKMLALADTIGQEMVLARRDPSVAAAVSAIKGSPADESQRLARGHAAFGRGRRLYETSKYREAIAVFDTVAVISASSRALRLSATLWKGISLAQSGPPEPAEASLRLVVDEADEASLPALLGRARWSYSSSFSRTKQPAEAIRLLRSSQSLFSRIGEAENFGTAQHLESLVLLELGDRHAALALLMRALRSLERSRSSVRLHNALYLLADLAHLYDAPHAALAARREDLEVAHNSGDPLVLAEAAIADGRSRLVIGDSSGAKAALDTARRTLSGANEGVGREWVSSDLALAESEWESSRNPARARAMSDSGIAFFRKIVSPFHFIPALQRRANLAAALGDPEEAQRDLEEVLTYSDRMLAGADRWAAIPLVAATERAYERATLLQLAMGDANGALRVLERGRSLLAVKDRGTGTPRAREGATVIDLALAEDTLIRWVVRGTQVSMVRSHVDPADLRALISRIRSLLELSDASGAGKELAMLYDLLIRPVESFLPNDGERLAIVADGELAGAPIAAALDTTRHRYLVERFILSFAQTLQEAQATTTTRGPLSGGRALLIADPSFDPQAFQHLDRLPGARDEVRDISTLYPKAVLLQNGEATWPAISRLAAGAGMIHFAGHVLFDESNPSESRLVVAAAAGGDVAVTPDSLSRLDLRGVGLVVLSACESARETSGHGGGLIGITAAFRRAGAHGVIGGLWRIDDRATRRLMLELHRAFRLSGDGAAALRQAQQSFIKSENPELRSPALWAGFRYVGQPNTPYRRIP
ncbi:MAG: CHAT domain-containing protein [Gemmatimonadaceae bacterium]